MYRVYSQQKPADALRAVVATALILAASTGVGWLMIRSKEAGRPVELDEPTMLETIGLRLQPPRGWTKVVRQVDEITVVTFEEPAGGAGRVLWIMSWPSPYAPGMQRSIVLLPKLPRVGLGLYHPVETGRRAPVGPFSGWQVEGVWAGSERTGRALNRVAWDPSGRTCLVTLSVQERLRRADAALIDAVCDSIEIMDLRLAVDLTRAGKTTGIHFALPSHARVVDPNVYESACVVLLGGPDGQDDWRIKVFRTWPQSEDGLESLVAACRIEQLEDMTPHRHIEETAVGVNKACYTSARLPEGWSKPLQSSVEVWAVRHRNGLAAMIVGESSGDGQPALHKTCEGIARSLRLTPSPLAPDAKQAQQLAEEIMAEITRKGVDYWWTGPRAESWYRIELYGDAGFIWQFRNPVRPVNGGGRRLEGGGMTYLRYASGEGPRHRDDMNHWWIDADGAAFLFKQWVPPIHKDDKPVRLSDRRGPASRDLMHFVEVESQRYQGTLTTPKDFLPDPIFELALYLLARRPAGQAALFSGMGSSEKMFHRRMCRSLGRLAGQDDGQGGPVYGVTVQLDHESTLTRYVFDGEGRTVRIEREAHYIATRTSRPNVEDQFKDPAVVDKALERWGQATWLKFGSQGTRPVATDQSAEGGMVQKRGQAPRDDGSLLSSRTVGSEPVPLFEPCRKGR